MRYRKVSLGAILLTLGTIGAVYSRPYLPTRHHGTTLPPAFYVAATGGSDSNAGTLVAPFATIGKAQTSMQASGTVKTTYLRTGTYLISTQFFTTSADNGETWSTYPLDTPQSAVLKRNFDASNDYWLDNDTVTNFTFTNLTFDGGTFAGTNNGAMRFLTSTNTHLTSNLFKNNSGVSMTVYNSESTYIQRNTSNLNEFQFVSAISDDGLAHGTMIISDNTSTNFIGSANNFYVVGWWNDVHVDRNVTEAPTTNTGAINLSIVDIKATVCGTISGNTVSQLPTSGVNEAVAIEVSGITTGNATIDVFNNTVNNVAIPFSIGTGTTSFHGNTLTNYGGNVAHDYAYHEDGGWNAEEWIGTNTLNGSSVTGWTGHTYGSQPSTCAASSVPP